MGPWVLGGLGVLALLLMLRARGVSRTDLRALRDRGARIVDVRTPAEFAGGHPAGAINVPVQELEARKGELPRNVPLLLCCASGSRSALAVTLLKRAGFVDVHNAGPWTRLREDL